MLLVGSQTPAPAAPRRVPSLWLVAVLAVPLLAAQAATPTVVGTQTMEEEEPATVRDLISVTVAGGRVYVADQDGARPAFRLGMGERVVSALAKGRVGALLTTLRVIFFADGSSGPAKATWGMGEVPPQRLYLATRVAVTASNKRILVFDGDRGRLVEARISSDERLSDVVTYEDMALVVTSERLLALAAGTGALIAEHLYLGESVTATNRQVGLVTVTTTSRIVRFASGDDAWSELGTF